MDEPRRSAAAGSGYLIPIALAVLLVAYIWPVEDTRGPITTTYSRLLGFRFNDQPLDARQVAGSILLNLTWLAVTVAALRPTTATGRSVVFGAAALLGFSENLSLAARLVFGSFVGVNAFLSGAGGALLMAGAVFGMRHREVPEIRESQEARA